MPIPGTKRIEYLEENAAAAEVRLSDAQRHELDELFAPGETAGERYLPEGMAGSSCRRQASVSTRTEKPSARAAFEQLEVAVGATRLQTSLIAVSRTCRSMPSRRCSTSTTFAPQSATTRSRPGQRARPVGDHRRQHHPAARGRLAQTDALGQERSVDVPAREHGADVAPAVGIDPPVHQRGYRYRARALHHQLRALEQHDHRLGHLVVRDGYDLVHVALDERQGEVARPLDRNAVADRVGRARAHRAARRERVDVGRAGLRLDPDHPRAGSTCSR